LIVQLNFPWIVLPSVDMLNQFFLCFMLAFEYVDREFELKSQDILYIVIRFLIVVCRRNC